MALNNEIVLARGLKSHASVCGKTCYSNKLSRVHREAEERE